MLHNTSVKAGLSAAAVISALLIPAAGSASAAPAVSGKTVTAAADSFDAKCRSHSRNYVLKKYYRQVPVGPPPFTPCAAAQARGAGSTSRRGTAGTVRWTGR